MNSKLFNLTLPDWLKTLAVLVIGTILAAVGTALKNAIDTGVLHVDWKATLYLAGYAALTYLSKQFLTDSQGQILGIGKK